MIYQWTPGASNTVPFVMVDANFIEVIGLDDALAVELALPGQAWQAGAGVVEEVGAGWYRYTATAEECPAEGVVAIRVTAVGCLQQNVMAQVAADLAAIRAKTDLITSGTTVTVVSSVDGGAVTVFVADTWRFTVTGLDLADYETLGLVVKRNERQVDSQALLYVRSDTGLARIGGAAPASAENGTLTAGASSFTAVVHVAETQAVTPGGYTWWLKGFDTSATPDEAATLATGEFVVVAAGLLAVV